jgi:hypothetical protein
MISASSFAMRTKESSSDGSDRNGSAFHEAMDDTGKVLKSADHQYRRQKLT